MLRISKKRAQTTAEYAILIAIVVGAIVAMQVFVKRGLQGRIRDGVTHVENANIFTGTQYEPYYNASDIDSARDTAVREEALAGGSGTKTVTQDISRRTGTQRVDVAR